MGGLAQEHLPSGPRLEDAALAFAPQLIGDAAAGRYPADPGLGDVGVQVIGNEMPLRTGQVPGNQGLKNLREIDLGAGVTDRPEDLTTPHIKAGTQRLGAMAEVLNLTTLDVAQLHRQGRSRPLPCRDTGHVVDRHRAFTLRRADGRLRVGDTDSLALRRERLIGRGRQPTAPAVRLEVGFFLKSALPSAARVPRPDRG